MRFLFVAYCFGNSQGQALIGVYKRGLRIALELSERGHEIVFFCTGRENFHDSLTRRAEERMQFVEFAHDEPVFEVADRNRQVFLAEMAALGPDFLVIGEAPLDGPLFESTLCAVELGIPVVVLDNAYQSRLVGEFCRVHGPALDGIVLNGLSSLYTPNPPPYLIQVPPYIEPSVQEARELLAGELGFTGNQLVTMLAYDYNVECLATSLLEKLHKPDLEVLFLSSDVAGCEERLSRLPAALREKTRVIGPPPERILFGLLRLSRLAVVKCAFNQVVECLSLDTPVIAYYYVGDFALTLLPRACQAFAHATTSVEADAETVAAARRFLDMGLGRVTGVHNGELDAVAKAAAFLESLPPLPRQDTWDECAALGFTRKRIEAALRTRYPHEALTLQQLRATRLRAAAGQEIYSVVCRFEAGGQQRFERMWGRVFRSARAANAEIASITQAGTWRQPLYMSAKERIVIERDLGLALLPSLQEQ